MQLGEGANSEALRSALGELELTGEETEAVEAINPTLHTSLITPPLHPSATTIIADVPTFSPSTTTTLTHHHLSSYATTTTTTTTDVPELSPPPEAPPSDTRLEDIELMIDSNYSGVLPASVEAAINLKWSRIVGPEFDIVVSTVLCT